MARNARAAAALAKQVINERKIVSSAVCGYGYRHTTHILSFSTTQSFSKASHFSDMHNSQHQHRFLSSNSSPKPKPSKPKPKPKNSSDVALIKSDKRFKSVLKNVEGKSLPAVFSFTAEWCGPCKFIAIIIKEMIALYPHVKFYNIDIDQKGLEDKIKELNITAVPTLHFFDKGKFAEEMIGADGGRLKKTMEKYYK